MAVKLVSFLITFAINVCAGVVVFFFMIMAMNGFSESDANYGIVAYIVLALIVSLVMGLAAAMTVVLLMKRRFKGSSAAFIAIPIFSVVGIVLKIVCSIIGLVIADYVRVNY